MIILVRGRRQRAKDGVRHPEVCQGREGLACFRCPPGFYGLEDCKPCAGWAGAPLIIVFVVIAPFIVIVLYRATTANFTSQLRNGSILMSTMGIGAFFLQTVAVVDTFTIEWPMSLSWLFSLSRIFMFDLAGLQVSCIHGNNFSAKYGGAPPACRCFLGVGLVLVVLEPRTRF